MAIHSSLATPADTHHDSFTAEHHGPAKLGSQLESEATVIAVVAPGYLPEQVAVRRAITPAKFTTVCSGMYLA